jgi:hypothetical protein
MTPSRNCMIKRKNFSFQSKEMGMIKFKLIIKVFLKKMIICAVKLGNKERFVKELIGISVTNLPFTSYE